MKKWIRWFQFLCVPAGLDPPAGSVQRGTAGLWRPRSGLTVSGRHSMCHQDRLHLQHAGTVMFTHRVSLMFVVTQSYIYYWLSVLSVCINWVHGLSVVGTRCVCPGLGQIHPADSQFQHHRDEAEEHWHNQDPDYCGPHWRKLPGQLLAWGDSLLMSYEV